MKKQIKYQAKRVKDLDFEQLLGLGDLVVVTVDVAKRDQVVGFSGHDCEVAVLAKWSHPAESREFLHLCERLRESGRRLVVVMEPSGTYGDWLLGWLWARDIEVRRVLGKQVHDGAAALDGTTSGHDAKSAVLLAGLHKLGASRPWTAPKVVARQLRAVGTEHAWFDELCGRLKCKVDALMARFWPELSALLSLRRMTYWRLMEEMGGPAAIRERPEEALTLMREAHPSKYWSAKVDAIMASAQNTLGVEALPEEVAMVKRLASEYERARKKRDELAEKVNALVSEVAAPSLVGLLGPAAVSTLLALNLNPLEFDHPRAFMKALGLGLKEKSSGTVKGRLRITKRGSPRARWLIVLAALRLVRDNPVVWAWYRRKRERDGRKDHVRNGLIGLVAVARKLAQAAWHVARGKAFDATLLFDVTRLDIVPTPEEASVGASAADDDKDDEVLDATCQSPRPTPRGGNARAAGEARPPAPTGRGGQTASPTMPPTQPERRSGKRPGTHVAPVPG